jgi:hypothetical protein
MLVLPEGGLERLVEERQANLGQVEQLVAQRAGSLRGGQRPGGDAGADARRAGTADDDGNPGLGWHAAGLPSVFDKRS